MRRAIAQRLEGSRFGAHIVALAHFVAVLVQPGRSENKRLPGITHRDAFTCDLRLVLTRPAELRTAG